MIFVWVFALAPLDWSFLRFRGDLQRTTGVVTASIDTRYFIRHRQRRVRERIFEICYTFTTPPGRTFQGASYSRSESQSSGWAVGNKVPVEYVAADPRTSRIVGLSAGMFSPAMLFIATIPAIGLALIIAGLRLGRKGVRLLRDGKLAQGTLTTKRATKQRVNNCTVYVYTFSFTADDRRTYAATRRDAELADKAQEPLLYDPAEPMRAVMLGALPGDPHIDEQGRINVRSPLLGLAAMIVPLASIIGHGACLLRHLWR